MTLKNYLIESSYQITETVYPVKKLIRCRDMQEAEDLFLKHFNEKVGITRNDFTTIFIKENKE